VSIGKETIPKWEQARLGTPGHKFEASFVALVRLLTSYQCGAYLSSGVLRDKEETGIRAFRVLFETSNAVHQQEGQYQAGLTVVQSEFIRNPHQSKAHSRSIDTYEGRGKQIGEYPASGY